MPEANGYRYIKLQPQGHIVYNGFDFSENILSSKINAEVVYDKAQAKPIYTKYTLVVEAIITADSGKKSSSTSSCEVDYNFPAYVDGNPISTDKTLEMIRSKLLKPGGHLDIEEKGFGRLVVSGGKGRDLYTDDGQITNDALWGPTPRILTWEPIAGNKAARVGWTVDFHLVECCIGNDPPASGLISIDISSKLKINKSGYKSISVSVTARFKDAINIPALLAQENATELLYNYHLEKSFTEHPDGKGYDREDNYTEIESPNEYPRDVVEIDATHRVSSKLLGGNPFEIGFVKWLNTMSIKLTLQPNIPPVRAWVIMTAIINERLSRAITTETTRTSRGVDVSVVSIPHVLSLSIEESLFKHSYSVDVVWSTASDNLDSLFGTTGLFTKLAGEGTSWGDWREAIRLNCQSLAGANQISNLPTVNRDSLYTDGEGRGSIRCDSEIPRVYNPASAVDGLTTANISLFGGGCPPEEASFLYYDNDLTVLSSKNEVSLSRYKNEDEIDRGTDSPEPDKRMIVTIPDEYAKSGETDYVIQDFGNDAYRVVIKGKAIRLGGPTNPPVITNIGGKKTRRLDQFSWVNTKIISPYRGQNGCPTYITQWEQHYEILGKPDGDIETERTSSGEPGDY